MPLPTRADAEAFVEADKMWRRVCVHALSRSFQDGAQKGDCRSLAICAADVNYRRKLPLGMVQRAKQPLHAIERQIDTLGVKPHYPRHDGIDLIHDDTFMGTGTSAAPLTAIYVAQSHPAKRDSWATGVRKQPVLRPAMHGHDKLLGMKSTFRRVPEQAIVLDAA